MRGKQHINKPVSFSVGEVKLKSEMDLVVIRDAGLGILKWGRDNMYPKYLLSLYKGQPQHQGIVDGKAKYLTGIKLKASTPLGEEFLKRANPKESHYKLSKKYDKTYTLYGCRAIKIVPNLLGVPLWFFHLDFGKCRITSCETGVEYCEDWTQKARYGTTTYPIWRPGCKEVSIYLFRNYNPTVKEIEAAYPGLEYEAAIKDIDTLKRIQNSRNSLVINDFSAGTAAVIYNEKPETKEEADKLVAKLKGNYSGDEQTGNMPVIFAGSDPAAKGAEFITVPTNGLDKKYLEVTNAATKNVFAAHNAPPELFNYIADSAPMFDKQKLVDQNELFMNTYVTPNQEDKLEMLKVFFELKYPGHTCDFEIEQFKPIGVDLLDPNLSKYLTNDEIRDRLGLTPVEKTADNNATKVIEAINSLSPLVANKVLESMSSDEIRSLVGLSVAPPLVDPLNPTPIQTVGVQPVKAIEVNEHLKNLTGKQTQGIMRIVRKFNNGEYSEVQATMLLKSGFGLTDSEVKEFLGMTAPPIGQQPIQQRMAFAKEVNFFALFDKYAHDVVNDEVVEVNFIDNRTKFAGQVDVKTNTAVLNYKKDNPAATNEQIATALGITLTVVASAFTWLIAKKFLDETLKPTAKAAEAKRTVFYTEYNYDKAPGVTGPVLLSTSRQFCIDFYRKFQEGKKALTYEAIDAMTNEFGENVWDYRGGWWTKASGEISPVCRHGFVGTTKIRYE